MGDVLEPTKRDDDFFGSNVAIYKDVLAIAALRYGVGRQSSTLVYRFGSSTNWKYEATLIPPLGNCGGGGSTCWNTQVLSVYDDAIAIGAIEPTYTGYAVVYRHSASGWTLETTLQRPNQELCAPGPLNAYQCQPEFGTDISMFGDRIVIGAPHADVQPASPNRVVAAGVAYVYHFDGTSWAVEQVLTAPSPIMNGAFGSAASIYEDRALIGETRGAGPGRLYIYHRSGTTWSLEATLATCDQAKSVAFGAVARLGPDVAVAGVQATVNGKLAAGAAHVFRRHGTDWIQEATLTAPNPDVYGDFGHSVAISDKYVLIGAPGAPQVGSGAAANPTNAGVMYLFQHDPSRTPSWNGIVVAVGLTGPTPSPSQLGTSVALWGKVAVAGSPTTCCTSATDNYGSIRILMACQPGMSYCDGPMCAAGAAVCDGDRATTCAADGMSFDASGTDCSAAGGTCSAGACMTPSCAPGQGACIGSAMTICRDDGLGTIGLGTCGASQVCDPGTRACVAPSCH